MDLEAVYTHLSGKPGAVEEFPFGPQALVFKVAGKMFALVAVDALPPRVTLKCVPAEALLLRERYAAVQPGYHMNKQHWNTVTLDGSLPPGVLRSMLDASYTLVVRGLTAAQRRALNAG